MILAKSNCMTIERNGEYRLICHVYAARILLDPTSVLMYEFGMDGLCYVRKRL